MLDFRYREHWKNYSVKILGLFISIVISLIVLEFGLKIFGGHLANQSDLPVNWLINNLEWAADPDLIFTIKSVQKEILVKSTNLPNTDPLILTLGDSFTEGNTVAKTDNYPAILSSELNAQGIKHTIMNVGIAGYNTDQETLLLLKILNAGIRPKVLIWSFYENDVWENGQQPIYTINAQGQLQQLSGTKDFIYQRQKFYDALPFSNDIKSNSSLISAFLHFYNLKMMQQLPPDLREGNKKIDWERQKIQLEINLIYDLAKKYNFFVVPVLVEEQARYETNFTGKYTSSETEIIHGFLKNKPNYIRLNLNRMSLEPKYKSIFTEAVDFNTEQYFCDQNRDKGPFGYRHFNELGFKHFGQVVSQELTQILKPNWF